MIEDKINNRIWIFNGKNISQKKKKLASDFAKQLQKNNPKIPKIQIVPLNSHKNQISKIIDQRVNDEAITDKKSKSPITPIPAPKIPKTKQKSIVTNKKSEEELVIPTFQIAYIPDEELEIDLLTSITDIFNLLKTIKTEKNNKENIRKKIINKLDQIINKLVE